MKSSLLLAVICALTLLPPATLVLAQDPAGTAADPEAELTYDDYAVKGYTLSVFAGRFSGDEYLNLPVRGERTFEDPDSYRIMSYDGHWFTQGELDYLRYDGPIKKLEPGTEYGVRIGTWLNENVHVDLSVSYAASQAVLTMFDKHPDDGSAPQRVEIDRDPDVKVYRAGLVLNYDLRQADVFGIYPSFGFGFGGVITQFSLVDDTGELYFTGSFGLNRPIADSLTIFGQASLTTFAMDRDELRYTKLVNFADIIVGANWFIDVVPADARARHEAEAKAKKTGRR